MFAVTLVALGACAATLPSAGWALDPGVHYDPTSPAGKQYAIVLADARGTGGGGGASSGGSDQFGAGITPDRGSVAASPHTGATGAAATDGRMRSGHGPKTGARRARRRATTAPAPAPVPASTAPGSTDPARRLAADGGWSGWAIAGGAVAIVLALGTAVAIGRSRMPRPRPSA